MECEQPGNQPGSNFHSLSGYTAETGRVCTAAGGVIRIRTEVLLLIPLFKQSSG